MTHSFTRSMTDTPFIYFGGDSHMAGDELADDTLQCWKDIYGEYRNTIADINQLVTQYIPAKNNEMHLWTPEQFQEYRRCQRDRHWTTIVCDKHGIKHHNDGLGGSSQEAMLHRAVISFDKFEQAGNVPTLAIIQLTSPGRVTVYDDKPISRKAHHIWHRTQMNEQFGFDRSFVLNFIPTNSEAVSRYCFAHMDAESETGNIIRWLTTLAITNSFFKEKTGRYPIYVSCVTNSAAEYLNSATNNETISSSPGYQSLVTQSRVHISNHDIWNLSHHAHLICPGHHHTPQTHANFAQFIAPHLLQELNNVS